MNALFGLMIVCVIQVVADESVPADFLQVDSKAWTQWLDERLDVAWHDVRLQHVLDDEFGAADLQVDSKVVLKRPITFDAVGMTRREALWRLSKRFRFQVRWTRQDEPRVFQGFPETQTRKRDVGGIRVTIMTAVMRSKAEVYQKLKKAGQISHERNINGVIYFSVDDNRDIPMPNGATAFVPIVLRYKAVVPRE